MGLRLLDVENQVWNDFWVNSESGVLTTPGMSGYFKDGAAIFTADDMDGDQPIRVRGIWDRITSKSCRWQQGISHNGGKTWTDNWFMDWTRILLACGTALFGAVTVWAQQQPWDPQRTPGVYAGADQNRAAFVQANCKHPVPPAPARRGSGAAPATPQAYRVRAIPGVIAAGQRWRALWTEGGANADSPIGVADGVLIAQPAKSQVIKVGLNGKAALLATDTYSGGALAMTHDGKLYIGERALNRSIWQVFPERKLFADTKDDEPLECLGADVLNDMVADGKGGIYLTMGGVYYLNPQGVVRGPFGVSPGNGLILSKDDTTLYVTGRLAVATPPTDHGVHAGAPTPAGGLVAFDVQSDGTLLNERQYAWAGGDGSAIDDAGRIYTTGDGGTWVIGTSGELLGFIASPRRLIGVAFGGPQRKTLFGVANNPVQVFAIDMIAAGISNRAK